jgi:hypothetical protein
VIDRLNFYDIYGHLLPGTLLLVLFAFPPVLIDGAWIGPLPGGILAILGVLALAAGYLAGTVLQVFASEAVPSKLRRIPNTDAAGHDHATFVVDSAGLAPSDLVLDYPKDGFSEDLRGRLEAVVLGRFGLDISTNPATEVGRSQRRRDAVQLCRAALVNSGSARYTEQFQALYSLARACAVALLSAIAFTFGFAGAAEGIRQAQAHALSWAGYWDVLLGLLALGYTLWHLRRCKLGSILTWLLAVLILGVVVAWEMTSEIRGAPRAGLGLALVCLPYALLAVRFLRAYEAYSRYFVATVFRDYFVLATAPVPPPPPDLLAVAAAAAGAGVEAAKAGSK